MASRRVVASIALDELDHVRHRFHRPRAAPRPVRPSHICKSTFATITPSTGRKHEASATDEVQAFYDDLSREGKALFDEFREFVAAKDEKAKVMQELAGHYSSNITMDIYTHVNMDAKREAVTAVSKVF